MALTVAAIAVAPRFGQAQRYLNSRLVIFVH